jgi:mRNA interferase RelE/StbE
MPARYTLEFAPAAVRALSKLDKAIVGRIKAKTDELCDEPRPGSSTTLVTMPGVLRVRVGDYRVLYEIDDVNLIVRILDAGHRKDIYGGH